VKGLPATPLALAGSLKCTSLPSVTASLLAVQCSTGARYQAVAYSMNTDRDAEGGVQKLLAADQRQRVGCGILHKAHLNALLSTQQTHPLHGQRFMKPNDSNATSRTKSKHNT
jgi:hypothetical protein